MRSAALLFACVVVTGVSAATDAPVASPTDEVMLRRLYDAALADSPVFGRLRDLVTRHPGRLAGSDSLAAAVRWAEAQLRDVGCDRIELQPVPVPHWDRGAPGFVRYHSRQIISPSPLNAVALGGSGATPAGGLTAPVVEVRSLDELATADVQGRIVFFNRPMNLLHVTTGQAYAEAVDQRSRGPAAAAAAGAVAALVRSMTLATDDLPHTGNTTFPPATPPIPAVALSTIAADNLSAALHLQPSLTVELLVNSRWLPDATSHNVVGEIRGREAPEKIILVGGHLDSWDIAPGAHDDGAGCVQSLEVLRLLRAAGWAPRHTVRVVLFTNEENGLRGATAYARLAGERREEHLLALESDSGGFQPRGFNLGNPAGDAHTRAARWLPLLEPYGLHWFQAGTGGADVNPLLRYGATVAGLTPDSQRYFDTHHTTADTLEHVNPRELQLGAAALAALVYLVDRHGI